MSPVSDRARPDDEIDLGRLLRMLWKGRWVIFATVTLVTLAFGVIAFTMTPVYRSTTVLIPVSQDSSGIRGVLDSALGFSGGALASLAGLNMDRNNKQIEEALAVLTSRSFIESYIVERNLMPVLFADVLAEGKNLPTLAQAHKFFVGEVLTIVRDSKTGLLSLQVEWRDRKLAAQWANELVQRINAEMRNRALQKAEVSLRFLEAELKRTMLVGTQSAINRVMEAQINQRMFASVTQEYTFQVVDPAMAPDPNDPIRPNKLMLLVLGFVLGGMISVGGILARQIYLTTQPAQ